MPEYEPKEIIRDGDVEYEVIDFLGSGGMGEVYRAEHIDLHREEALKILQPLEGVSDAIRADIHARFKREAQVIAQLNSPYLVRIYDWGKTCSGKSYYSMEYINGKTLRQVLSKRGNLLPVHALSIAIDILMGLDAAHKERVVHRDCKPENIFLCEQGVAKLLDFGVMKLLNDRNNFTGERFLGTYGYASPEQIRRSASVDAKSDVFAMGVILFESLTGYLPFGHGRNTNELIENVLQKDAPSLSDYGRFPRALVQVVQSALSKSRDDRPTAYEFAVKLRSISQRHYARTKFLSFITKNRKDSPSPLKVDAPDPVVFTALRPTSRPKKAKRATISAPIAAAIVASTSSRGGGSATTPSPLPLFDDPLRLRIRHWIDNAWFQISVQFPNEVYELLLRRSPQSQFARQLRYGVQQKRNRALASMLIAVMAAVACITLFSFLLSHRSFIIRVSGPRAEAEDRAKPVSSAAETASSSMVPGAGPFDRGAHDAGPAPSSNAAEATTPR